MITIAEVTDAAIRVALLRHWWRPLAQRRPPQDTAPAEAVRVAGDLARTLAVLDLLRGTRRESAATGSDGAGERDASPGRRWYAARG
jgi:hypothetical protein